MTLIGAIGTIGVALLFFAVFRTLRSVIQALVLVGIGLTAGLGATLAVFPSIHVLVFVFAAMLVGIVSDYAVHTLASGPATGWTGTRERIGLVGRPITVSMITTVLGFGGLAIFGVPLFQQVALLSGVGIITAWAFVLFVLVPADRAPRNAAALAAWWTRLEDMRAGLRIPQWLSWGVAALMTGLAVWGAMNFRTLDDVRQFQPRSADLAAEEEKVRAAGYDGSGVSFLLSRGATLEEAREREEAALASAPAEVNLLASTRFDPSAKRRAANAGALGAAVYEPHLAAHAARLGLDPEAVDTSSTPDAPPPAWLESLRGEASGTYFLVAPVLGSTGWAGPDVEGVWLVDPAQQYSEAFRAYSGYALIALAAAFLCGLAAVLLVYRRLAAISILVPAVAAVVLALLVQVAIGFPLTFFSYAATLVLVGVGVDYAAFQWEAGERNDRWTSVAVAVDAATTLLSMGLLILSSTYPVRSFGLTVTIGIVAALCLSHIPRQIAQGRLTGARRHGGGKRGNEN
jgi:predicted exporter